MNRREINTKRVEIKLPRVEGFGVTHALIVKAIQQLSVEYRHATGISETEPLRDDAIRVDVNELNDVIVFFELERVS